MQLRGIGYIFLLIVASKKIIPAFLMQLVFLADTIKFNQNILGDIIISVESATVNAKKNGHSFYLEMMYLLIHGLLHLKGYDHSSKMFKIQDTLFEELEYEYRNHK